MVFIIYNIRLDFCFYISKLEIKEMIKKKMIIINDRGDYRMKALIGYTGFVGGNLASDQYTHQYNSKTIKNIVGQEFDQIVCAGVRAEKFLANRYPEQDLEAIQSLIEILKQVKCKKFVLISTIDVYKLPQNVDENTSIELDGLHTYGKNRYYMEEFVRNFFEDYLIIRLPALYGKGLKKNFIYDMVHKIPSMIMGEIYDDILLKANTRQRVVISENYLKNEKGDWNLNSGLMEEEKAALKTALEEIGYTSLVFTDYRSSFPFYHLANLQKDIDCAIKNNIKELNIAVEPVSAAEVAKECFNVDFANIIEDKEPVCYDMKSIHADKWGGANGYLYSKAQVLFSIKMFVERAD